MNTLELIESRRLRGNRDDDYRLTLAIDGGGMRGIVSGAMLVALRDLCVSQLFDEYVGASAAAINLAHWAQGRGWDGLAMYYDYLPENFFRGRVESLRRPILKMEYLDELFTVHFPLSSKSIAGIERPVIIFATDVDLKEICQFDLSDPVSDAVSAVKASSWLPILAGGPMKWRGARFVDGGILAAHPLYVAMERGATHVLALSPAADVGDTMSARRSRPILAGVLDGWSRGLGKSYLNSRMQWDHDRALLDVGGGSAVLDSVEVTRIAPLPGSHQVTRLTRDLGMLLQGARSGYTCISGRFDSSADTRPPFRLGSAVK